MSIEKTKAFQLFQCLETDQMERFERFLCSPYWGDLKEERQLFLVFRKTGQANVKRLDKADVWRDLYGKEIYEDLRLRRLFSSLLQQMFDFLAWETHRDETLDVPLDAADFLLNHDLDKHFNGLARKTLRALGQLSHRDYAFHNQSLRLREKEHSHQATQSKKSYNLTYLSQASYHLDVAYLLKKLRHWSEAINYQRLFALETDINIPPGLLEWTEQYVDQEPVVKGFYLVIKLLKNPEQGENFHHLKTLLGEQRNAFSKDTLKSLYLYLINYAIINKINAGQTEYYRELFDIYQILLSTGLLFRADSLPPQEYKNIISLALNIGEFTWLERFINEYTQYLPEENLENARAYNLAKVFFHRQQYHRVIEQLRSVAYDSHVYALGSKLLLLMTYYELQEFLALDSLADSFRIYLQRNRIISKNTKRQYLNLIRFLKKLSNLPPQDQNAVRKLQTEVEQCSELAGKNWLLGKICDLTGRVSIRKDR